MWLYLNIWIVVFALFCLLCVGLVVVDDELTAKKKLNVAVLLVAISMAIFSIGVMYEKNRHVYLEPVNSLGQQSRN